MTDIYNNLDFVAFKQAGLSDIYETLGECNLFMFCRHPNMDAFREPPDGYIVRLCRRNELETWKKVIAYEAHIGYVTEYYDKVYKNHEDEFYRRCSFICDASDNPVASCFVW